MFDSNSKIVVIGGGTGTSAVLRGLKERTQNLTAVVNMVDNGGSSGVLRSEHGLLPPGDIRQCLVALSTASAEKQSMFGYRYESGFLAGHSFGNLFLSTAEKMTGDFIQAIDLAADFLESAGKVVPVTLDDAHLCLSSDQGDLVGQSQIDGASILSDKGNPDFRLFLEPNATIHSEARDALLEADYIVIAPGDLYTSLAPMLLVEGVAESIYQSRAKLLYVCNLTTKQGHTTGFTVQDHANAIEELLGSVGSLHLDHVVYNDDYRLDPSEVLKAGEQFVSLGQDSTAYTLHGSKLVSEEIATHREGDILRHRRSRIRHDSSALALSILKAVSN